MKYSANNQPLQCFMTQSTCYKGTSKMTVKGVLWHSTGANNPTLKRYVQPDDNAVNRAALLEKIGKNAYGNDWNHIYHEAGLNCWIGKLADGTVTTVQTMPWDYKPWGCGSGKNGSCNNGWIQFEICEDDLSDKAYFDKIYKEACEITAYLCQMFGIDPNGTVTVGSQKVPTILCHADSHSFGLGSNHGDVNHWFPKFGKSMATARADVTALLKAGTPAPAPAPSTGLKFKVGDIVNFAGGTHYTNANAVSGSAVKASRAKITQTYNGKHPYHCRAVNDAGAFISGVYGWVDENALSAIQPSAPATGAITVGALVKIIGSTYYSGAAIPAWVKAKNWYVKSLSGDRVVIDKSEDGKNAICSPVKMSDLALVSGGSTLKSVDEIAREVINGKWGNGTERKQKLTAAGYDYSAVQARVNEML